MTVKSIYIGAIFIASITLLKSQNIIPIDYDALQWKGLTELVGQGYIHVINKKKSFFNAAYAMLYIIDNQRGTVLKTFDESTLDSAYNKLLAQNYEGIFNRYEDYVGLNTCQQHPYVYERITKISDNLYACDIISKLKKIDTGEMVFKYAVMYLNDDLEIIDIFDKETYPGLLLTSGFGIFYTDKSNFYIKKAISGSECDYVHYQLIENKYCIVDELPIPGSTKLNYMGGRYFVPLKIRETYYFNNGEKLIQTDSLFNIVSSKEYKKKRSTHKVQLISNLVKHNDNSLAGFRLDLKEDGVAYFGTIFQSNLAFTKVKDLKIYNLIDFSILSLQAFGGKLYAFMYNRKKNEYFMDVFECE